MIRPAAITVLTASVLLLGSCMHGQEAMSSGMAWSLHETPEEGAKLAYGAPNSDNVALMLSCQPASGQVLCKAGFLYTGDVEVTWSEARQAAVRTRMMVWLA